MKVVAGTDDTNTKFKKINGVSLLDNVTQSLTISEIEVGDKITSPITSWEIERTATNNNLVIYEISIDGKPLTDKGVDGANVIKVLDQDESANTITVDSGEWDASGGVKWSNFGDSSGAYSGDYTWAKAFDGSDTTVTAPAVNKSMLWDYTAEGGISYASKVELTVTRNVSGPDIKVNGTNLNLTGDGTTKTVEVLSGSGTLNTLRLRPEQVEFPR